MAAQKKVYPVEWDINEKERFKELVKDIKKRSESLAQRIKIKVKESLILIQQNPRIFEADQLKEDNDGSYRKFTAVHIRIVYKIDTDKLIIVRVRPAVSEPHQF